MIKRVQKSDPKKRIKLERQTVIASGYAGKNSEEPGFGIRVDPMLFVSVSINSKGEKEKAMEKSDT